MSHYIFSSESVTKGHPDKVSDQISDAILDAFLAQDPNSRVACEVLCTTGLVVVSGEITSKATVEITKVVRETIRSIGYTEAGIGFDADSCAVHLPRQAEPTFSQGSMLKKVGKATQEQGAGDQGMMFGYACNETRELMPLPISLAHQLAVQLEKVRERGELDYLRPDGKSQVSVEYDDQDRPIRVSAIVLSTQHREGVSHARIERDLIDKVVKPVIPASLLDKRVNPLVNPQESLL